MVEGSRWKYHILSLRRAIGPNDLHRYLTVYARRIRHVLIRELDETFSVEAWQALQLAMSTWNPSSLAPCNLRLTWGPKSYAMPQEILRQTFPYYTLLISHCTQSFHFNMSSQVPVQVASVYAASYRPSKELEIYDAPPATLYRRSFSSTDTSPHSLGVPCKRSKSLASQPLHSLTSPCSRSLRLCTSPICPFRLIPRAIYLEVLSRLFKDLHSRRAILLIFVAFSTYLATITSKSSDSSLPSMPKTRALPN